jgi:DNA-binding MarR family transcriptional regulator
MAMSENSKNVLNYLKGVKGDVTSGDVAEALGLEKRTVDGAFTSMQKKGLGIRVDGTAKGTKEISFLTLTGAVAEGEISDNAKAIIAHLTANAGINETLDDVADAMGMDKRVINGTFNSLVKKGIAARVPATVEADVAVKFLKLTDAGMACDPDADAE